MRRVIIESPFKGNVRRNKLYARAAVAHALALGDSPFASHLLYTQPGILDDTLDEERALGIAAGFEWRTVADATIVYIDLGITGGMKTGILDAQRNRRTLQMRSIDSTLTLDIGLEPIDEALTRAATVLGNGNSANYYDSQAMIVNTFEAAAKAGWRFVHYDRDITSRMLRIAG